MNLTSTFSSWVTLRSTLSPSTVIWHQKSGPNGILYVESFDGTVATCCKRILTATSKVIDWPDKYKILEKDPRTPPLTQY